MPLAQFEPKKIYIRVEAHPITTPWVYHNSDLWLISLSSDGSKWITIADKNLWATQVYNDGDTLSEANCGTYFQRWNNYGFPRTWSVTTSSSQVNAQNYWPWNYYSGSTFITQEYSWDSSNNNNLWGWATWTPLAMKWPCAEWYHVPSKDEMDTLISIWVSLWVWGWSSGSNCKTMLKMPYSWRRNYKTNVGLQWSDAELWCATVYDNYHWYGLLIEDSRIITYSSAFKSQWSSIRPFKNEAVQPDDSRTKLY